MAENQESTVDTILHLKRRDPFVAFSIVMASGDRYRIENPDAFAVAATQLHYYPADGMGIHMRLNQVVAVEDHGDGASKRRARRRAS